MPAHRASRPHESRPVPVGDRRRALGRLGEELAAAHLCELGFHILQRNARTSAGEMDLIAFDGRTLVFAEVKTRRVSSRLREIREDQEPLGALSVHQRLRLRRLAAAWLQSSGRSLPFAEVIRFDAIGVLVDQTGAVRRLDHIEAAW